MNTIFKLTYETKKYLTRKVQINFKRMRAYTSISSPQAQE